MKLFNYIRYHLYDDVKNYFFPKQKWLTKQIPNSWCDKVELIPRLLFACLIDFVDNEKGLDRDYDWSQEVADGFVTQEYADNKIKIHKELMEAYEYIKNTRRVLLKEMDEAYPPYNDDWLQPDPDNVKVVGGIKLRGMKHQITDEERRCYKNVYRIEKKITKLDMKAMNIIIKHHGYLWT